MRYSHSRVAQDIKFWHLLRRHHLRPAVSGAVFAEEREAQIYHQFHSNQGGKDHGKQVQRNTDRKESAGSIRR